MKLMKRLIGLSLALATVFTLCFSLLLPQTQATASTTSTSFAGVKGPTLVKCDGVWYYVKNGAVCYDRTLVKYSGAWWFVKDGKVASDLTTLVKYNNEWWYVVNGKVASNTTSLVKYNNEWWYVVKGKIASKTTSLVKYNNEWWYVVKGKIASNTTSLVKYNNEWWYVVKGKIAAKTTTLVKYNGSWYYIVKGKMAGNTTGFVNYGGAKYYVKNGVMQSTLNGKVTVNGGTYFVKNGALTNCHSAGHSWKAATCTAPKTCTKCLLTEGSALGHNYGLRGIIVEATCTTDGEKDMACTRCGDSYTAVIEAPGHHFVDGRCTWCDIGCSVTMGPDLPLQINLGYGSSEAIVECSDMDYTITTNNDGTVNIEITLTMCILSINKGYYVDCWVHLSGQGKEVAGMVGYIGVPTTATVVFENVPMNDYTVYIAP